MRNLDIRQLAAVRYAYGGGNAFDPDYQAVLDYMIANAITLPTSDQQTKGNTLMIAVKAALGNDFTRVKSMRVYAQSNADAALVDWSRLVTMTAVNSPTYSTANGFTGNTTSAYINTGFAPNFVQSDNPWALIATKTPSNTGVYSGVRTTIPQSGFSTISTFPTINDLSTSAYSNVALTQSGGVGETLGYRRSGANASWVKNGTVGSLVAHSFRSLGNLTFWDLARNFDNVFEAGTNAGLCIAINGVDSLTADEALDIHTAIQTYLS
jgi:hypothetical protein